MTKMPPRPHHNVLNRRSKEWIEPITMKVQLLTVGADKLLQKLQGQEFNYRD